MDAMNFPKIPSAVSGVRERLGGNRARRPGGPPGPDAVDRPARDAAAQRGFPMPLALQGALELITVAAIGLLLAGLLTAAVWLAGGFGSLGAAGSFRLAGQLWLLAHCAPLGLEAVQGGASQSGALTLIPLGLTLIPFGSAVVAGRRIARACWRGQFLTPFFTGMVAYAGMGAVVALISATDRVSTSVAAGALFPLIPVGLGTLVGGWSVSRSLASVLGADAASWLHRTSQYSRWAGSYAWAVVRAGFLAAVAVVGSGALITAGALAGNWDRIVGVYQYLGTGAAGDTALTALQFGYLPNLVVWAAAWASGAGFSVGADTLASPLHTSLGTLPQFPVLEAIPRGEAWPYAGAFVVLPVLAGMLAGWWFLREGENHLDDWMAIRLPLRWLTFVLSTLLTVALIAAVGAGLVSLLAWLSHGSLGLGRLSDIGPHAARVFGWLGAELTAGAAVGYVLGPWLEREGYRDNPWNVTEDTRAAGEPGGVVAGSGPDGEGDASPVASGEDPPGPVSTGEPER